MSPYFSVLGYVPKRVELLDDTEILCLAFWETIAATPLHQQCPGFQFLHILTNTCCFHFLVIAILMGVKWYVMICIFLVINILHMNRCSDNDWQTHSFHSLHIFPWWTKMLNLNKVQFIWFFFSSIARALVSSLRNLYPIWSHTNFPFFFFFPPKSFI